MSLECLYSALSSLYQDGQIGSKVFSSLFPIKYLSPQDCSTCQNTTSIDDICPYAFFVHPDELELIAEKLRRGLEVNVTLENIKVINGAQQLIRFNKRTCKRPKEDEGKPDISKKFPGYSKKSINVRRGVEVELEELEDLSADPRLNRHIVELDGKREDRESHSHDYDDVQDIVDDGEYPLTTDLTTDYSDLEDEVDNEEFLLI